MPKGPSVRVDRIEITNPQHDENRYILIDSDGDLYIQDGCCDDAVHILFRKNVVPSLIRALRIAAKL